MNGLPAQDWLNALLVLLQNAQLTLRWIWHTFGFTGDSHGQPAWPWAYRIAGETLMIDLGLARQVLWSLAAAVLAFILLGIALVWRRRRFVLLGGAALTLLVAPWPATNLLFVPAVPTSFHTSPSNFAIEGIAHGEFVYAQHCLACHGEDGRGEGPLAKTLRRWPPTFVGQLLGRRADGDMFWRIRNGMIDEHGQTTMPAFAEKLSDADTWAVLDYLKVIAAGSGAKMNGNWPIPIRLPDVAVRCGKDEPRPLSQWRSSQRVRIVAIDSDPSSIPLDDPRFKTLLVTRYGNLPNHVPAFRSNCVAESSQAWSIFAQLAGESSPTLKGTQLLADRAGWLRARGAGNKAWSDADLLCKAEQPSVQRNVAPMQDGLAVLLNRIDAEPVRFVKGGFIH